MNLAMLSAAVPCIWLMEGELLEKRVLKQEYSPPGVMVQIGGVSFEERVYYSNFIGRMYIFNP